MLQLRRSNEQQYSNSLETFREVFIHRTLVPLIVSGDSQDRLWAVELTRVRSCLDRQRLTRKLSCSAQARVKQACQKARIVKPKSAVASVFFSSDVANPDTYLHFYSDSQMNQSANWYRDA